jgi:chemotaxis methyl-accepting protein methylase
MSGSRVSDATLDRVTDVLHRRIGLRPEQTLRSRLRRCLRDGATEVGSDVDSYVEVVLDDAETLQRLINRVTVQETAFFRHPEHFDVLARDVLPRLSGPVTMWSAGCANGQEPYSLAMLLDELRIDGSVIATDLSTAALQRARAARYSARELTGLSPARIDRHLSRVDHEWEVNPGVRSRVTFSQHNLLDALPHHVPGCHVVFCRNVLIYFAPEHARAFLDGLGDAAPEAALFIGSAETIWPVSDRFDTVHVAGSFYYRPRAERGSMAPSKPAASVPGDARVRPPARLRPVRRAVRHETMPAAKSRDSKAPDCGTLELLARTGQRNAAEGDHKSAVVAFRKCAYLAPHDPITHLHLGLALDACGDSGAARRAYAAARRALLVSVPGTVDLAAEGYTTADLLRLLDAKLQVSTS